MGIRIMSVTSQALGNAIKVTIDGHVGIECYEDFNHAVVQNLKNDSVFTIDLKRTVSLDSSALGMLLLLREKMNGDMSRVLLINVNEPVLKVLNMAKFDLLFSISSHS